jgi:AraC-like DNA-binding protein
MTIVEVALTVGFQTQAHFTAVFKKFVGCTQRNWRMASQLSQVPPLRSSVPADMTARP